MNAQPRPIYLDYHATTPADPRVVAAMSPWWTELFGNPHSVQHAPGREAEAAVEAARASVAAVIGADPREIIFTSGATEANNLAIKGAARFLMRHRPGRTRVVTLATEHKCVLESARALEREGFEVTILPVDRGGLVDLDALRAALADGKAALVSVMAVNNEIGTVQPLAEIGRLARDRDTLFHTDAAQGFGKVALDVEAMNVDLLSISGHKVYGPKGVGALYVRRRPRVRLVPLFDGGGQERGLRSGTLPTPLCIGLGAAATLAASERVEESVRVARLRDRLRDRLRRGIPGLVLNGDLERRVAGNLNIAIPGIPAMALIEACPGLALSAGSACSSAALEPSYVLSALGLGADLAAGGVRIGLGRFTTEAEIDAAAAILVAAASRLMTSALATAT